MILRSMFHCKNAGFEDLTIGILHFWFLGAPGNSGSIWVLVGFLGKCKLMILRSMFHCKNAGFEDLTIGILHFWFLGLPGNSGIIWVLMVFF